MIDPKTDENITAEQSLPRHGRNISSKEHGESTRNIAVRVS